MPIKRRAGKARHLDEDQREQLRDGPDSVLFAGAGYLAPTMAATFARSSPEVQAAILAQMREDWATYGAALMEEWRSNQADTTVKPWALLEFGEPYAQ
jgi:hypothetical protein